MIELGGVTKQVVTGVDNIVIRQIISTIEGGRALDITDYKTAVGNTIVSSGCVIIRKNGTYKPMPIRKVEDKLVYEALPEGWEYAGILIASIDGAREGAGILTAGMVNKSDDVMPASVTSILADLKTALPGINFMEDGE